MRPPHERHVAAHGKACGRPVRDSIDAHGRSEPRTGLAAHAIGQPATDSPQYGIVVVVWSWERK